MDTLTLFWILLKGSLFSTGGTGNLPILFDELIARGWATEQMFAESLAIGQLTPGPTGLWVISLGYLVNGVVGALLATLAVAIPPLSILVILQLYNRAGEHPAVEGFVRGLGLAVVGIFLVVLVGIFRGTSADWRSVVIALAALGLALTNRFPVLVILGLAGLAGILLYR